MQLQLSSLRTNRQWRAATGLPQDKFMLLLDAFGAAYEQIFGRNIEQRTGESPNKPSMKRYDELLLFTLFSLKSGLTYDLLGFVSGMDGSNAQRNQQLGLEVLELALSNMSGLPKRSINTAEEFALCFKDCQKIIIDATEQAVQRPQDYQEQKEYYSGKKTTYGKNDGH